MRMEHREPQRESTRNLRYTRLATLTEDRESMLPEALDGVLLVGEGIKGKDPGSRVLKLSEVSQEPSHRLLASTNDLALFVCYFRCHTVIYRLGLRVNRMS